MSFPVLLINAAQPDAYVNADLQVTDRLHGYDRGGHGTWKIEVQSGHPEQHLVVVSDKHRFLLVPLPRTGNINEDWYLLQQTQAHDSQSFLELDIAKKEVRLTVEQVRLAKGQFGAGIDTVRSSQKWKPVTVLPVYKPEQPARPAESFQERYFSMTAQDAAKISEQPEAAYDLVIIGTGAGGGVLAADLWETNRQLGAKSTLSRVLVLERGNLVFHSHSLNTSRPPNNPGSQPNDEFFTKFKSNYNIKQDHDPADDWSGGPVYTLGGRSAVWGLFAPRVHDEVLRDNFDPSIFADLLKTYYRQAESLTNVYVPTTQPKHQNLIDRLNISFMQTAPEADAQWQWGRISSEFNTPKNYGFAQGAFSSIDKLLEIAMANAMQSPSQTDLGPRFDIVDRTSVRRLCMTEGINPSVKAVEVQAANGSTVKINCKKVVLSAGSVHSPAILLRSGFELSRYEGGHITDHDLWYYACSFQYNNPLDRQILGSMKLQTYLRISADSEESSADSEESDTILPSDDITLANVSLDTTSFLPRGYLAQDTLPKVVFTFINSKPLVSRNTITLGSDGEPVVTLNRYEKPCPQSNSDPLQKRLEARKGKMERYVNDMMATITDALDVQFYENQKPRSPSTPVSLSLLPLGGVAHELGSLPTPNARRPGSALDADLSLRGCQNIYVCDNSIFPISPEVNPTVTLIALALRLSHELLPRQSPISPSAVDTITVANRTGFNIKVWVSNRAHKVDDQITELKVGGTHQVKRQAETDEVALVYRLEQDTSRTDTETTIRYVEVPETYVAKPGKWLSIV